MERRRELHPDEIFQTRSGREIPVVSEESYLTQVVELARFQMFAGGVITALVQRHPTDLPGEMVTVGAVVEWKDRTDAKPQPEPVAAPRDFAEALRENVEHPGGTLADADVEFGSKTDEPYEPPEDEAEPRDAVPPAPASDDGIDDGIEVDPLAVDESEIPAELRS
jgi:hypothetical protein